MPERVDVTVLGGGPVGLFASFYAGLRQMSVRVVDSLPELGGQLIALYPEKHVFDMPGFPKALAKDLAREMIAQGVQFGPELALGETAVSLESDGEQGWTIRTDKGGAYPTRTLIIAAGAGAFSPTKIGLEGEESWVGRGLTYGVKRKADFTGKHVVIVGGGDSAFDWALSLSEVASKVTLVHRRDQFRAHEHTVQQVRELPVEFKLWKVVKAIEGNGRLEAVALEDTRDKSVEQLPCDAVVVNIGFKSSLGPIKGWGLEIEKNQIKVDSQFRTNLPGVFAVGDVCVFENKIKLIATGVGEAATAVCVAKTLLDPAAKLFPGHSSDMQI